MMLIKFIENYGRFAAEQPSQLSKDYTKDSLLLKADEQHDSIWGIIQRQRDIAINEKNEISSSGWVNKEIDKLLHNYLNIVGCEMNKLHYQRLLMQHYVAMKEDLNENELDLQIQSVNFNAADQPAVDPEELIPHNAIYFQQHGAEEYFEQMLTKLNEKRDNFPPKMLEVQDCEIKDAFERLQNLKDYIVHKIKKIKLRYTAFVHRMEDWIVFSVKTENSLIYDLINSIKECINNEVPHIEFHLKYFDPLLEYKIIDFKIAPKIVLPEDEQEAEDYFSFSQLYLLLTDLRNLNLTSVNHELVCGYNLEKIVNHFCFRIKNNYLGVIKMFPDTWISNFFLFKKIDLNRVQIERIFRPISEGSDDNPIVYLKDLATLLILWRYPTPTLKQLNEYKENFAQNVINKSGEKVDMDVDRKVYGQRGTTMFSMEEDDMEPNDQSMVTYDEFMKVSCWLDQWDETLCIFLVLLKKNRLIFGQEYCLQDWLYKAVVVLGSYTRQVL